MCPSKFVPHLDIYDNVWLNMENKKPHQMAGLSCRELQYYTSAPGRDRTCDLMLRRHGLNSSKASYYELFFFFSKLHFLHDVFSFFSWVNTSGRSINEKTAISGGSIFPFSRHILRLMELTTVAFGLGWWISVKKSLLMIK